MVQIFLIQLVIKRRSSFHLTQCVLLHYLGEILIHEIALKWTKNVTINSPNIIDRNLKKDGHIFIAFGTSIPDTTGHQTTVQVPLYATSVSALPAKDRTSEICVEMNKKTSINFISVDLWPPTALTSVSLLTMFAVSCSSESIGRCLGMSMNSRSDWLKSGAEHYQHCYQWMERASACLCSHKGPIFWILSVSSWTTGQLDKLSAKVTEIWTKCALCVFFSLNNHTTLNKNVIFRMFWFTQVVQKQTLGEVRTWTVIWWPVVSEIFVRESTKIC